MSSTGRPLDPGWRPAAATARQRARAAGLTLTWRRRAAAQWWRSGRGLALPQCRPDSPSLTWLPPWPLPQCGAGRNELMDDVLSMVLGRECHNRQMAMLPAVLIDLASLVCPF